MKKVAKRITIVLIVLAIVSLALGGFSFFKSRRQLATYEKVFSDSLSYFKEHLAMLNDSVYEQKQIIVSLENATKLGLLDKDKLEKENWKLVEHNLKLKTTLYVLRDSIEFLGEPVILTAKDSTGNMGDYIQVPLGFSRINQFYEISGNVNTKGVYFDRIVLFSYPEITVGWKSDGFLKQKEPVVTYYNKNPYYVLNSMDVVTIKPQGKRWYESKLFWFLSGMGTTFILDAVIKND